MSTHCLFNSSVFEQLQLHIVHSATLCLFAEWLCVLGEKHVPYLYISVFLTEVCFLPPHCVCVANGGLLSGDGSGVLSVPEVLITLTTRHINIPSVSMRVYFGDVLVCVSVRVCACFCKSIMVQFLGCI